MTQQYTTSLTGSTAAARLADRLEKALPAKGEGQATMVRDSLIRQAVGELRK